MGSETMTSPIEGNNPLSPPMLGALRSLLSGDLPRQGDHFVSPCGIKYRVKTIDALVKHKYCRLCHDSRDNQVARVNESLRSVVNAELGAHRRAQLAAEADKLAEKEV